MHLRETTLLIWEMRVELSLLLYIHQISAERALREALPGCVDVGRAHHMGCFGRSGWVVVMVNCAIMRDGCVVLLVGVSAHLAAASISGYHHVRGHRLLVLFVAALHKAANSILSKLC